MFTRKIKMTWTTLRHLVLVNGLELKVVLKKILLLDLVMMMSDIEEIKKTPKQDKAEDKRVEFHLHTSMSQMDGIPNISAYVEQAAKWGTKL